MGARSKVNYLPPLYLGLWYPKRNFCQTKNSTKMKKIMIKVKQLPRRFSWAMYICPLTKSNKSQKFKLSSLMIQQRLLARFHSLICAIINLTMNKSNKRSRRNWKTKKTLSNKRTVLNLKSKVNTNLSPSQSTTTKKRKRSLNNKKKK